MTSKWKSRRPTKEKITRKENLYKQAFRRRILKFLLRVSKAEFVLRKVICVWLVKVIDEFVLRKKTFSKEGNLIMVTSMKMDEKRTSVFLCKLKFAVTGWFSSHLVLEKCWA